MDVSNTINLDKNNQANLKVIISGIDYLINQMRDPSGNKYYFDILFGAELSVSKITQGTYQKLTEQYSIKNLTEYADQLFRYENNSGKKDFVLEITPDQAGIILSILDLYRNYIKLSYICRNNDKHIKSIAISCYNAIVYTMRILQGCLDTDSNSKKIDNTDDSYIDGFSNKDLTIYTAISFIKGLFKAINSNSLCKYNDLLMKRKVSAIVIDVPTVTHQYLHDLLNINTEMLNDIDAKQKFEWTNYKAACVYSAITNYLHFLKTLSNLNEHDTHQVQHAINITNNAIDYMKRLANKNNYTYDMAHTSDTPNVSGNVDPDKAKFDQLYDNNSDLRQKVDQDLRDHPRNSDQSDQDIYNDENVSDSNQEQILVLIQDIIERIKSIADINKLKVPLSVTDHSQKIMRNLNTLGSKLSDLTQNNIYHACVVTNKPELHISSAPYSYDRTELKDYTTVLETGNNKNFGPDAKRELQAVVNDPHVNQRMGSFYIKITLADGRSYRRNLIFDDIILAAKRIIKYYDKYNEGSKM